MNTLPIIDIAPLYQPDESAWMSVARQIDAACRDWGFFYIVGHPIGSERIDALRAMGDRLFGAPLDEKLKIDITQSSCHRGYGSVAAEQLDPEKPADLKETFDMGFHMPADHPDVLAGKPLRGPNNHPDIPGWEALLEAHYQDMHQLGLTLLRGISLALGIDRDFFDQRFEQPVSAFRMIHYPPSNGRAEQHGAGAHTDYGCVTLLYQDQVGGLQVQSVKGEWIDAPPIPGSFVVNIGDMMARWSNDRYKSTPHRVLSPEGVDRFSMPFFVEPHPDTVIECLPNCSSAENPPKYPQTTCAEWLLSRFAATYAYRRTA